MANGDDTRIHMVMLTEYSKWARIPLTVAAATHPELKDSLGGKVGMNWHEGIGPIQINSCSIVELRPFGDALHLAPAMPYLHQ